MQLAAVNGLVHEDVPAVQDDVGFGPVTVTTGFMQYTVWPFVGPELVQEGAPTQPVSVGAGHVTAVATV